MKFSIKDFLSKYDQVRKKLRIWSHLLKKSFPENFVFLCSVSKTHNLGFLTNSFCESQSVSASRSVKKCGMLFCGDFFVDCLASVLVVDNVEKLQKDDTFQKKIKNG